MFYSAGKPRLEYPKDEIKADWDDSYDITNLTYIGDTWTLVTAKNTDLHAQQWYTRLDVESLFEEVKKEYKASKMLVSVTYGAGLWALVSSKGTKYTHQYALYHKNGFPQSYMDQRIAEGYYLSDMAFGAGSWFTVFSKDSKTSNQMYHTSFSFPKDKIESYWDKGYRINLLKYLDDRWVLSMILNSDYGQQAWRTRYEFPKKEIDELWKDGYSITDMSYLPGSKNTALSTTSSNLLGTWVYEDYFAEEYIEFLSDGFVKMTIIDLYNDTTTVYGGSGFTDPNLGKVDIKFETNTKVFPYHLDIVVYQNRKELQRNKAIYKIDKDQLTVKAPESYTQKRAVNFNDEDSYSIDVYTKSN